MKALLRKIEVITIKHIQRENVWDGRTDEDEASLRYHQVVSLQDSKTLQANDAKAFSIIGFQCDEGVRRNQGRVGAAMAPNEIRKHLASIPYTLPKSTQTVDVGNVRCVDGALEKAQRTLGEHVSTLFNKNYIPIILGGGHETFYGHYLGVRQAVGEKDSIGMINIDAHFDLRVDDIPSSGTMFHQILSEDSNAGYFCLGIQPLSNTETLFKEAKKHKCTYVFEEDVMQEHTFKMIDSFSQNHDHLIVTLCTDSIVSTAAPGVSAPSPFGLEPKVVKQLLRYIVSKRNIRSFDISEVNPKFDNNSQTSRLAAYIVADVMHYFVGE